MRRGAWRPPRFPFPDRRDSRQSSSSLLSEQSLSSSHLHTEGMQRSFRHRNWSSSHSLTGPVGGGDCEPDHPLPTAQPRLPINPAGIGNGDIGELRGSKHLNPEGGQGSSAVGPTDGTARLDPSLQPVDILCIQTHSSLHITRQIHADPAYGEPHTLATHAPGARDQSPSNLSLSSARRGPQKRIVRKAVVALLIIVAERACQINQTTYPKR